MTARVIVVTDRHLFGSEELAGRIAQILARVPRGSVGIQVREKDLDGGPLLALVREIQEVTRPHGAPLWINERLDVALASGALGVHLPERGLSIEDALSTLAAHAVSYEVSFAGEQAASLDAGSDSARRALLIGCSRHTPRDAIAAAMSGASLVQLGPIWSTPGKGEPLGTDALAVRRELPPHVTLVAVGGIDSAERARQAAYAGADAVAVIRAAWTHEPELIAELVEAVEAGTGMRMMSLPSKDRG